MLQNLRKIFTANAKCHFQIFFFSVVTGKPSLLFKIIQGLSNNCIEVGIMLYY